MVNWEYSGVVRTPMMDALEEQAGAFPQSAVPLGRDASATEVANLISFLLSDEVGFVNGAIYKIDGVSSPSPASRSGVLLNFTNRVALHRTCIVIFRMRGNTDMQLLCKGQSNYLYDLIMIRATMPIILYIYISDQWFDHQSYLII